MNNLRTDCPMRHENGNCTVAGGFCTAVNDQICEALHHAYDFGYKESLSRDEIVSDTQKPLTLDELRTMAGEPVWCSEYQCYGITLFSRVSRSPEDMAEFLLDKVILSPCEVICGGECSAIGNLEQTAMDQCKKKIIDFLNQDINNIGNERK